MGNWPGMGNAILEANSDAYGTLVQGPSNGIGLAGAWTELIPASTCPAHAMLLHLIPLITGAGKLLTVDLGIGDAGSEKVLAPGLLYQRPEVQSLVVTYPLPLFFPSGSRLTARVAGDAFSSACRIRAQLMAFGWKRPPSYAGATSLGVANGRGTSVLAGNGAWGTWTTLTVSNPAVISWLALMLGGQGLDVTTNSYFVVQLAIGAVNSEKIICKELLVQRGATDDTVGPPVICLPLSVPNLGNRISARIFAVTTGLSTAMKTFDVALLTCG